MENKRLIEQLKAEIRQARQNLKDGKCIPREEFVFPRPPFYVAESSGSERYRATES